MLWCTLITCIQFWIHWAMPTIAIYCWIGFIMGHKRVWEGPNPHTCIFYEWCHVLDIPSTHSLPSQLTPTMYKAQPCIHWTMTSHDHNSHFMLELFHKVPHKGLRRTQSTTIHLLSMLQYVGWVIYPIHCPPMSDQPCRISNHASIEPCSL
jgi:hypothetical protein